MLVCVGSALTVQHLRYNSDCDGYEELAPIDENLMYDFDFQQITHLRNEVIVKPVSAQGEFCNITNLV